MALSLPAKKSWLIWVCVLLCLLPFVILSFFNVIAYDDYSGVSLFAKYGFFGAQQVIYSKWEGRFTATLVCGVCVELGLLTKYYFLVFPLFGLFTWGAIFFFLRSVNSRLLNGAFRGMDIALASLILFILDIYVMVEMSSGIYWFSPTAVYQTAFILLLLLMGCLVRRLSRGGGRGMDVAILLLCILIAGCNEVCSIALVCFFLVLMGVYRYYGAAIPKSLFLYMAVVLATGVIIMLTSGILVFRQQVMERHRGPGGVILILLFRVLSIFYYILKEPLFWACAGACFILGLRVSSYLPGFVTALKSKPFFLPGIGLVILLIVCTLAPVLFVTHGSIPERALNDMTSLAAFGVLTLVFLLGVASPDLARIILPVKHLSTLVMVVIACGLLFSFNYKEAWKNIITGYFYHAIQTERQQVFMDARSRGERVATILSYQAALDEKVGQVFPHGAPVTLRRWLEDRPTLLYFDNEVEDHTGPYLRLYYGFDSIMVRGRR